VTSLVEENDRLRRENLRLAGERAVFIRYIREKVNELLVLLKCPTMNADNLGDIELIGYDPIGTIAVSFSRVLDNLKETNERLTKEISERKRYEEELQKAEKLESIGILAGGIAHDFNNLLTGVLGNLSIARIRAPGAADIHENLSKAEKACLRARDLTRQLLIFSKGGAPIRKATAIAAVLRESAECTLRGSDVLCEFSLPDDLPPVDIDEGQIGQVVNNLIVNADQAMPGGGTLRVEARTVEVGPGDPLPIRPGRYVRVTVSDTGIGIPKEALPRIFDPFYTTKEKGSGLGLTTAYSILRHHDGMITAVSEPGEGTTFSLYLPVSRDAVPRDAKPAENSRKGRVLVMDDEAMVREVALEFLGHLGYEGEAVVSGEEAIAAYRVAREAGRPYSAVIMDLTIPGGMGGKAAVRKLRDLDPDVRAIVSSGYSNDPVMADPGKFGFRGVIAKPYRMRELGEVVDQVLSGGGAASLAGSA
jgi:signal transduction histidine kinase/ActR/RegA family two-component response regulator